MEVAPFFVDFHHFLSIFTIFYRFSRFTHFCRDLHFVAIYILSRFTHFFRKFFLAKKAFSATSHGFCMYPLNGQNPLSSFWKPPLSTSQTYPTPYTTCRRKNHPNLRLVVAIKSALLCWQQWQEDIACWFVFVNLLWQGTFHHLLQKDPGHLFKFKKSLFGCWCRW